MTAASAPEHPASAEDGQLARLFERNAKWAEGKTDIDPGFFQRLVDLREDVLRLLAYGFANAIPGHIASEIDFTAMDDR